MPSSATKHFPPIAPHVLIIGARLHPYWLPVIERLPCEYATEQSVRVKRGENVSLYPHRTTYNRTAFNVDRSACYPLRTEEEWQKVQELYKAAQDDLTALANFLRTLGSYASRLNEATDAGTAQNPLCSTVIATDDPDDPQDASSQWLGHWGCPKINRNQVIKHTKVRIYLTDTKLGGPGSQRNKTVCWSDEDWTKVQELHQKVGESCKALSQHLNNILGHYPKPRQP